MAGAGHAQPPMGELVACCRPWVHLHLLQNSSENSPDSAAMDHWKTGLSRRSLPALPVRMDAGGAHRAAGEAVGARAGGRGDGGSHTAGADRPTSWHVHDAAGVLGRRGGAVLADPPWTLLLLLLWITVLTVPLPTFSSKQVQKAWQPEDKTQEIQVLSV